MEDSVCLKKKDKSNMEEEIHQLKDFSRLLNMHNIKEKKGASGEISSSDFKITGAINPSKVGIPALFDEKSLMSLFHQDTLRISHVCPTSEMNDVKAMQLYDASFQQLRKLIINRKIKKFACDGAWYSVCNYLFFLMGVSTDQSIIYACWNLLGELTRFPSNNWAPTPSDLLAVFVNQGANGSFLSRIPVQIGIRQVEMPSWPFTTEGFNGEKPALDKFTTNLKLILDFFSVDIIKRHLKYGQAALPQFLHMFISVIFSEIYTNKPGILNSRHKSINAILNTIEKEFWEVKGYSLAAALGNSYAFCFISNPERTNFFCEFMSSCKPRGLLLSRFFARSVISLLTKIKVDALKYPSLQNIAEIVQNVDNLDHLPDDYIWLCIQCLEVFGINESSTDLVTLQCLHSWLEKLELASLGLKLTLLLEHWRKIISSLERRSWVMT